MNEYFEARKRGTTKEISGTCNKEKWQKVREYAMYRGCPSSMVEDALINFVIDQAYEEAKKASETDAYYRDWRERRSR